MKYFRIPAVFTVTDLLLDRLAESAALQSMLEGVLSEYFTHTEYTEGALSQGAKEALMAYLEQSMLRRNMQKNSENQFDSQERTAEACLAEDLWSMVICYSIRDIDPVSILIGTEGEAADVTVPYVVEIDTLRQGCDECVNRIVPSTVNKSFSFSGLWSLGKALMSDGKTLLNKAFLLGVMNPEKVSALAEVMRSKGRPPILAEMQILGKIKEGEEPGNEYEECACTGFIEQLRYFLFLYRNIENVSKEWKDFSVSLVVNQIMQLNCKKEAETRAILNVLVLDLLGKKEEADKRKLLLLVDTASILEGLVADGNVNTHAVTEYCTHIYKEAELLGRGLPLVIREELAKRIVALHTSMGSPTDLVNDLIESRNWAEYVPIVAEYHRSQNTRMEITISKKALPEISLYRSIKRNLKRKRTAGTCLEENALCGKKYAYIEYADKCVNTLDKLYAGERIVIVLRKLPESLNSKAVYIKVDTQMVRILNGKVRMRFGNMQEKERIVSITAVVVEVDAGIINIPVNYELRVLPTQYVRPALLYTPEVCPFGVTKVWAKGIVSKTRELFLSCARTGYKSTKIQVSYGEDSAGRRLRIHTPHVYADMPKHKIAYKVLSNSDISYRITGRHEKIRVYNGRICTKRQKVRVNRRRVASPCEDDALVETEQKVSPVEAGIAGLILHSERKVNCTGIEQAVRYYLYKKNGISKLLKPFMQKNMSTLLDTLPVCASLAPVLLVHANNTIIMRQIPLEKRIRSRYGLLGAWTSMQTLLKNCLFERKALQIKQLFATLSAENADESMEHRQITPKRRVWHTNTALACASQTRDGVVIYIQNYSAYANIVCIIGMKITNVQPLQTVIYRSQESLDGISIIMNTV
ncbi:hypothetical protein NEAUS07_0881 [Nematocida ausubeli]|nr:hypothetical protein NEAUS07_0881 [Nematocida ausubeli]